MERYTDAYTKSATGDASLRAHFECYLVRLQGRTLLVDTGLGNANSNPNVVAQIGSRIDGVLLSELEKAEFKAADVDTVFLTHLHPDHVGWNVTRPTADSAERGANFPQRPLRGSRGRLVGFRHTARLRDLRLRLVGPNCGPPAAIGRSRPDHRRN